MSQFMLLGFVLALVLLVAVAVAAYRWGYDQGRTDAETFDLRDDACDCPYCASVRSTGKVPDPDAEWIDLRDDSVPRMKSGEWVNPPPRHG